MHALQRWISKALTHRGRCYSQTEAPAGIPKALFGLLEPSPVALSIVKGAGRTLVCRTPIQQGQRLLQEWPLVCVPSLSMQDKVCHRCLAALGDDACNAARPETQIGGHVRDGDHGFWFCSPSCYSRAMREYLPLYLGGGFRTLEDKCRETNQHFPLLVAKLACAELMARQSAESASAAAPVSPALSSSTLMQGVEFLSFANVYPPYPEDWIITFGLLLEGLKVAAGGHAPSHRLTSSGTGEASHSGQLPSAGAPQQSSQPMMDVRKPAMWGLKTFDMAWYAKMLGRFHINSFRQDAPVGGNSTESLMAAALAAIAGPSSDRTGSAVYLLASMFNHSCSPNAEISFPLCNGQAAFTAARDIEPGEQVTSRAPGLLFSSLVVLCLAACGAGALRCEFGELPGRWTGNPPVWQPLDTGCQLQEFLEPLLTKAAQPADPLSPAALSSSRKTRILIFGDSVDRMTVNDTCLATSTIPEPVEPVGQHEDRYLLLCETASLVMGVQSMIGIQPQGPYRWNLTGTPRDRIQHGAAAFRNAAGGEPDIVLFATSLWDIATWLDHTQLLESEDIDDLAFANWMTDFGSALAYIKELTPSTPVHIFHTAASTDSVDCQGWQLHLHLNEHAHIAQLNAAGRWSAKQAGWHVVDFEMMTSKFVHKRLYLRDRAHPSPWFLLQAVNIYLNLYHHQLAGAAPIQ
ncbi:hypothetical protein WJX84_006515 [Apatococcus fuscideae]|uniref:SET domain-containing protein n=1 Tax=Apatococcus fuscideae TaxID=2026836 RepID=A0AAW1TEL5_9CHLO